MRILVFGSNGQLGKMLQNQFQKDDDKVVIYKTRKDINLENIKRVKDFTLSYEPNIIINSSAYTNVDRAEEDYSTASLINSESVAEMAKAAKDLNALFIHVSTDYVFDGKSKFAYDENAPTIPLNNYGQTKLNGENSIIRSGCKYAILRTSWLFSEEGRNFFTNIVDKIISNEEIRVVDDQVGCPTYAPDLAEVIKNICDDYKNHNKSFGLFHYCGQTALSWYSFAINIGEEIRKKDSSLTPKINKAKTKEFKSKASRPSQSILDCRKIISRLGADQKPLHLSISRALRLYLETNS